MDKDIRKKMKQELMKEYNMSAFDTELLMERLDSVGACSYAAAANDIISYFRYKPNQFEKIFGFPLYTINSSGSYAINCARLLADMYIWFNSVENDGKLFHKDDGKLKCDEYDFSKQNYVWIEWNRPRIEDYIRSKTSSIVCENTYLSSLIRNMSNIYIENIKKITDIVKAEVAWYLNFRMGVTLYIEKNNSNIRFIDTDTGEIYISTFTWNEGAAHIVKVTEMTNTGFIVSTWGKRCLVPFEDLEKSKGFDIYITTFREK